MKFTLAVFTPETFLEGEVALIQAMFTCGLRRLHIRKPGAPLETLEEFLLKFSLEERARIVVHSFPELVGKYGLFGAHATSKVRTETQPLGRAFVSASTHSAEELERADGLYKYLFVSPVFESISKEKYGPMDRGALLETLSHMVTPVFALGGISHENLRQIFSWGFSGAGVLGAVWKAKEPLQAFLKLQEIAYQLSDNDARHDEDSEESSRSSQGFIRQPYIRL